MDRTRGQIFHSARSYQQLLGRLLRHNAVPQIRKVIDKTLPADLSPVLPLLLEQDRDRIISLLIDAGKAGAVLLELEEHELDTMLDDLSDTTVAAICASSAPDDAADLLDLLDEERRAEILDRLGASKGAKLEALLLHGKYETAGSLMTTDFLALNENLTVAEAIEVLRAYPKKDTFFYAYTVDDENQLKGVLSLRTLLLAPQDSKLSDVMLPNVIRSSIDSSEEDVASLVAKYDLLSIPVVDAQNRLIGVVTVDDVIDVIQEQADEDLLHLSGVAISEKVTGSARAAIRSRFPWLIMNLCFAFVTAGVVSLFEGTIQKWAILAAFMPIVAGLGGNAGTQALTVFVRGLALEDVSWKKGLKAVWKELLVGLAHGVLTGALAAIIVGIWTGDWRLSVVILLAMIVSIVVAGTLGGLVPLILKHFDLDPAVSSSIFVTTLTDVSGFFAFLGLATLAITLWGT